MSTETRDATMERDAGEDRARADCYALLGRLYYEPPDAGLLVELCADYSGASEAGPESVLTTAWRALRASCKRASPEMLAQEYDSLFVSVGRAVVSLYTTSYIDHTTATRHLVALRQKLGAFGLGRRAGVFDVEDHISGLCDAMRLLIRDNQPLAEQKQFFLEFIFPGAMKLCDAVERAAQAEFYGNVAKFGRTFLQLEKQYLDMTE